MQTHFIIPDSLHLRKLQTIYFYFHKQEMRKNNAKVMLSTSKTNAKRATLVGQVKEFSSRAVRKLQVLKEHSILWVTIYNNFA